jgi:hypothetical protein
MKENNFQLSHMLNSNIQGMVGEIIALDYIQKNLKRKPSDTVTITRSSRWVLQLQDKFHESSESARGLLQEMLIGLMCEYRCDGIDITNADIEAKRLFDIYKSKNKDKIISELEQLYTDYEEEKKSQKWDIKKYEDYKTEEKSEYKGVLDYIKAAPHQDLAKVLTLIELEKKTKNYSDASGKIRSLVTCSELFFFPLNMLSTDLKYNLKHNHRDLLNIFSNYINAKYEKLNLISAIYKGINQTKTRIDLMIVHCSSTKLLEKIILAEIKTGKKYSLSEKQRDFADYIKRLNSDKVEYKIINVDYQVPKNFLIKEDYV